VEASFTGLPPWFHVKKVGKCSMLTREDEPSLRQGILSFFSPPIENRCLMNIPFRQMGLSFLSPLPESLVLLPSTPGVSNFFAPLLRPFSLPPPRNLPGQPCSITQLTLYDVCLRRAGEIVFRPPFPRNLLASGLPSRVTFFRA